MPEQPLREQSLDELVAKVQGLAAAAAASEVRSIMAVFARCTIEISDRARQLSEDINQSKKILGERLTDLTAQMKASTAQATHDMLGAKEAIVPVLAELTGELKRTRTTIDSASTAASKGTDALVRWTKVLVFATIVYVLITGGLFAVSVLQLRAAATGGAASFSPAPSGANPARPGNVR